MKPRVVIIHKGGNSHTWCEDLRAGFVEAGSEACVIALRDRGLEERWIQSATGRKHFENSATLDRLEQQLSHVKPALVVLLNYAALPEEAHARIRQSVGPGTPLVSWLADHIQQSSDQTFPNLDGIYYFDSATLPALEDSYRDRAVQLQVLPLAVNLERFQYSGLPWQNRRPGLAFVGNNTESRREVMHNLQSLGGLVSPYGPNAQTGLKFWKRRKISPTKTSRIYGSYQAVLNMLQPPNTVQGLNLRAFEIPASGGLGTYPLTADLAHSFTAGSEIIAYHDVEDLHSQLAEVCSNPTRAKAMIAAGRQRVIREHTYALRAQRLLRDWLA